MDGIGGLTKGDQLETKAFHCNLVLLFQNYIGPVGIVPSGAGSSGSTPFSCYKNLTISL